ncbi:hypothetical protein SLEP1_g19435 [Rubroshorea leprosula]|uniref:Uncharacterized protein n=1 Tax=Rubroshorea leprosula TaxID=152421 RepID=A0AAV5J589_9ROSI|nr:hypothetical protein SLEP1_g19435 [Rubroshorea leprosula]
MSSTNNGSRAVRWNTDSTGLMKKSSLPSQTRFSAVILSSKTLPYSVTFASIYEPWDLPGTFSIPCLTVESNTFR